MLSIMKNVVSFLLLRPIIIVYLNPVIGWNDSRIGCIHKWTPLPSRIVFQIYKNHL